MDLLPIFLVFVRLFLKVLSCHWLVYSIFPYKKPTGLRYSQLNNISNLCAKNTVPTLLLDTLLKNCRTRLEWSKEVQELLTFSWILKPRFVSYILDFKTLAPVSYSLVSFDTNRSIIFNLSYKHSHLSRKCFKIFLAQNPQFQLIQFLANIVF
jgi:hypothetical protein